MSRRFICLLPLALILVGGLPGQSWAQRGRYNNTPAMTPYGPVFNPTMTPEYRQAGGNWDAYNQLMMQKMMMQEQKAAMAYQKQWDAYLKANPDVKKQLEAQQKRELQAQQKLQRDLLGPTSRKKTTKKSATTKADDDKTAEPAAAATTAKAATRVAGAPALSVTPASTTAATKKSGKK